MQAAGVTPKQYMENWLLQINYPEVAVSLNNTGATTELTFKQDRYTVTDIDETDLFVPILSPFK